MKLSVIICTHNPREDYLLRTLEALKNQTLPMDQWELLLIDNASKEPLSEKWDLSWHPKSLHIREEELGLTPARIKGIQESKGEILVFVDDDNLLDEDYLEKSIQLLEDNKKLGCIGAAIIKPEFEKEPEAHLKKYCDCLALRDIPRAEWSNNPDKAHRPYGAGLVVIKRVATEYIHSITSNINKKLLGRNGSNLLSGEDDEFSFVSCEMGYGYGIFPELKIIHLISESRVDLHYLLKITEGHGFSLAMLYYIHGLQAPKYHKESRLTNVIKSVFCFSISSAINHLHNWWFARHASVNEKLFRDAWASGVIKATKYLEVKKILK
jgi:glycosyltransferase involved in cell wall biosynthesis